MCSSHIFANLVLTPVKSPEDTFMYCGNPTISVYPDDNAEHTHTDTDIMSGFCLWNYCIVYSLGASVLGMLYSQGQRIDRPPDPLNTENWIVERTLGSVFETLFFSGPERTVNARTPSVFSNGREWYPWKHGRTEIFETLFRNGLRKFPLVRHIDSRSFSSLGFENGNMFTNTFSLARFSCERVLGLFSAPEMYIHDMHNWKCINTDWNITVITESCNWVVIPHRLSAVLGIYTVARLELTVPFAIFIELGLSYSGPGRQSWRLEGTALFKNVGIVYCQPSFYWNWPCFLSGVPFIGWSPRRSQFQQDTCSWRVLRYHAWMPLPENHSF
jgi:hypothetical protein